MSEITRIGVFTMLANLVAGLGLGALLLIGLLDAKTFAAFLAEDSLQGAGLIENLTVLVLVPGIVAGLWVTLRRGALLPNGWLRLWVLLWSLACVYFAGEEISWGQWFFGWETPEMLKTINDQQESNLHNMSTWLDQKPRAVVELFIVLAGIVLPVWDHLRSTGPLPSSNGWSWVLAPIACLAAGCAYLVIRVAGWIETPSTNLVGHSEFRELCIASFLSLYLISYYVRSGRASV